MLRGGGGRLVRRTVMPTVVEKADCPAVSTARANISYLPARAFVTVTEYGLLVALPTGKSFTKYVTLLIA